MINWQELKIEGIAKIEKCVAEFDITELEKTPYAKFKIKVYQDQNNIFTGYTNLQIKDSYGDAYCGVGDGKTVEDSLKKTIENFLIMLNEKKVWAEDDFEYSDPCTF